MHQIWRVLRRHEIALARRRSWCISTDPAFAQKAADIVALYVQPPEAVVLAVDEKPHIQALERAQGWLKLPNGKALTGFLWRFRIERSQEQVMIYHDFSHPLCDRYVGDEADTQLPLI
jgi:hypothetical protein